MSSAINPLIAIGGLASSVAADTACVSLPVA
jgi:hypothetical protein